MNSYTEVQALEREQFLRLLDLSENIKRRPESWSGILRGRVMGCIFEKPSTRTRVSVAVAALRLGVQPLMLPSDELQLSRGESLEDTGRVLSEYLDIIVLRTFDHSRVVRLVNAASVPVVNGLSNDHHPCQALADIFTIRERFRTLEGRKIAFIGDARSNIWRSLAEAVALCGMQLAVASPPGYGPDPNVLYEVTKLAEKNGGGIKAVVDPAEAAKDADVIYPEIWVPMEKEGEREQRIQDLSDYKVDDRLFFAARPSAVFLHCLPAFRGQEVTSEVLDGTRSLVWRQAANRLYTSQAVLYALVTGALH